MNGDTAYASSAAVKEDDCMFLRSGRAPPPGFDVNSHLLKLGRASPMKLSKKSGAGAEALFLSIAFAIVFAIGAVGFVTTILPASALSYIGICAFGIFGLGVLAIQHIQKHGLLGEPTGAGRQWLLEMSLLEFCLDDRFTKKVVAFAQEILPVFICSDDRERKEALANMSAGVRRGFTTKGLIYLFPDRVQRLLLPAHVYQERLTMVREAIGAEETAAAAAAAAVSATGLQSAPPPSEASAPPPPVTHGSARLEMQRLFMTRILRQKRTNFLLNTLPASSLRNTAAMATGFVALQLLLSGRARTMLGSVLRAGALSSACAATGLGLLLLRTHAELAHAQSGATALPDDARHNLSVESIVRPARARWARASGLERHAVLASAGAATALVILRAMRFFGRKRV